MGRSLRKLLPDKFETLQQAKLWRSLIIRDIARVSPDHAALPSLSGCEKARCGLEGCPVCRRTFRRQLASEINRLGVNEGVWTAVTYIPRKWRFRADDLHEVDLRKVVGRTLQALRRQPFLRTLVIVGGIDISWEVHDNGAGYWQLHIHVLVRADDTRELELAFRSAFRPEPTSRRPYTSSACDPEDFFDVLTYGYKNRFERNSHYDETRLRLDGAPRRNSRTFSLSRDQSRMLAEWLLHSRVGSRLILVGIRRTNRRGSRLRLKMRQAVQ